MTVYASNAFRVEIIDAALPSWYNALSVGNAKNLTASSPGAYAGTAGVEVGDVNIFSYSGGFLVTGGIWNVVGGAFVAGTFLCLHGGGHGAYNGNEIAAYGPLESDTRQWYWACPATPIENTNSTGNQPVSQHTYSHLAFMETAHKLLVPIISSRYSDSAQTNESFTFDFTVPTPTSTNGWAKASTIPNAPASTNGYYGSTGCYDSVGRKYYGTFGGGRSKYTAVYDLDSNTWTRYPSSGTKSVQISDHDRKSSAIDTSTKVMMVTSGDETPWFLDCRSPGNDYYKPTMTGFVPTGYGGVIFDSVNNRFVYYEGGNTLYYANVPSNPYAGGDSWNWTANAFGGDTAPSMPNHAGNGMYNRFQFVNGALRGYIACAGYNTGVSFFRV